MQYTFLGRAWKESFGHRPMVEFVSDFARFDDVGLWVLGYRLVLR